MRRENLTLLALLLPAGVFFGAFFLLPLIRSHREVAFKIEGDPVSFLWLSVPVGGVVRVSAVYTPPELRGRGYASACVAGASARALAAGADTCVLYTDRSNPTSNRIYQRIGYRPVDDSQEYRFS